MSRQVNGADAAVHEISGVVPKTVIEMLLASLGIDPKEGAAPHLAKGFQGVKDAVKQVGREGWSAGQVLEQVSKTSIVLMTSFTTLSFCNQAFTLSQKV